MARTAGLSLRGPNRLGASELDEGALTAAVVNSYAQADGSDGAALAEKVLPARRHLWRMLEVHAPQALAAALRARLLQSDQTGRGGVRDLRRAVADWLDPPPKCHRCGRPITAETELIACPSAKPRGVPLAARAVPGRGLPPPAPRTCAPHPGPQKRRPLAGTHVRNGTLSLFSPVQMDPACAAAQKLLKHGGAAWYDIACDRDGRILLAASDAVGTPIIVGLPEKPTAFGTESKLNTHGACQSSTTREGRHAIHKARRALDRAVEAAIRANGRLILNTQVRYFSPKGATTRADLVQGGALGCRRALMDFDPRLAKFSTYAINWIYQGIGEAFADRDLVAVPDWAASLRREVEDRGIAPGLLLADIVAIAEVRRSADHLAEVGRDAVGRTLALLDAPFKVRDLGYQCAGEHQQCAVAIGLRTVGQTVRHLDAVEVVGAVRIRTARGKPGDVATLRADVNFVHAWQTSTTREVVQAANHMPGKVRTPITDERAQEQVALVFARAMNLDCTGGALVTALRFGAATLVSVVGMGESDGDDARDGDPHAATPDRAPAHLRVGNGADDLDDPEALAAEEDAAQDQWRRLKAALEALRAADPEAAEVVRRRHALDRLGDPETLEQIAAGPLQSTRRELCRESVRKAYTRGERVLRAVLRGTATSLPASPESAVPKTGKARRPRLMQAEQTATAAPSILPAEVFPLVADDEEYTPAPRRPHGPFRPRRPERVVTTHTAAPSTTSDAPQAADLGAWTAAMEAAQAAF